MSPMLRVGRLGLFASRPDEDDGWILGLRFFRNAVHVHVVFAYVGAAWFRSRRA